MKRYIAITCLILTLLIALVVCFRIIFIPVKQAIRQDELNHLKEPYYLIQWVQVTGSEWMIIGDQNGQYEQPKYIVAKGEIPSIVKNYDIATGHNTYICYGEYSGKTDIGGGEILETYQFNGWDILYPVKRNTPIPFMPKGYLCTLDFK